MTKAFNAAMTVFAIGGCVFFGYYAIQVIEDLHKVAASPIWTSELWQR